MNFSGPSFGALVAGTHWSSIRMEHKRERVDCRIYLDATHPIGTIDEATYSLDTDTSLGRELTSVLAEVFSNIENHSRRQVGALLTQTVRLHLSICVEVAGRCAKYSHVPLP